MAPSAASGSTVGGTSRPSDIRTIKTAFEQIEGLVEGGAEIVLIESDVVLGGLIAYANAVKVAHKALAGNLCGNIARTMAELDERAQRRGA